MVTAKRLAANLDHLRRIALVLPEATEAFTWETVNFRVRNKIFLFAGDGARISVKADKEELPALLGDDRFRPAPYLARGGWVQLDLTGAVDWAEVAELVQTSYCQVAPKKLAAQVPAS